MSVRSNPYVETNGLVFCYDMSNTQKSWKGKPTTNYVITKVENYTGWSGAGWWMHPGNTTSVTSQDLPDGNIGPVLNATALSTGGLYGYNGYALSAAYVSGTQYTVSFWARSFNGTASISVRDADSGGALSSAVSGITNNWARFSFTWTANASSNMLTFTGTNFSLYNVQLEINSFATPFVVGTRSDTQAIVDLTNINVVTANALTYNSNNTFSFNNIAASSLSIPDSSTIRPTSVTVSTWVKMDVYNPLNDFDGSYPTIAWKCNSDSSGGGGSYGLSLAAPNPRFAISSTQLISASPLTYGVWVNLVGTYTAGSGAMVLYRNGAVDASTTGPASIPYSAQVFSVGTRIFNGVYQYPWNGSIGLVQLYNRALSAAEIRQNFYAHKGRYGL